MKQDDRGGHGDSSSSRAGVAISAQASTADESRLEAEALAVLLSDNDNDNGNDGNNNNNNRNNGQQVLGLIIDPARETAAKRAAVESALTRLAARYLVRETVRGKILDPVGNFHVREGVLTHNFYDM